MQEKSKSAKGMAKGKDLFGHKAFSSASLPRRAANYQTLFAKHNFLTCMWVTPFLSQIPQENREKLKELMSGPNGH